MGIEMYEPISECAICDKPAEVLYFKMNIFGTRTRFFCKKHAREHQVIKKAH